MTFINVKHILFLFRGAKVLNATNFLTTRPAVITYISDSTKRLKKLAVKILTKIYLIM